MADGVRYLSYTMRHRASINSFSAPTCASLLIFRLWMELEEDILTSFAVLLRADRAVGKCGGLARLRISLFCRLPIGLVEDILTSIAARVSIGVYR